MGRRQRRKSRYYSRQGRAGRGSGYGGHSRRFTSRRRSGWGMNLYRNTRDGKIAGVCAGLADHWEVDHWVVRIAAVILFLFMGPLAFWAYVAGWILLARRPRAGYDLDADSYPRGSSGAMASDADATAVEMEYDEYHHAYRPRKMFRYGAAPAVRLQRARERLDAALRRVEDMESYVTSRQYNLSKEFNKL